MKKYLLIFCILLFGIGAQSQVLITLLLGDKLNSPNLEFGLEGGINWTQITGMETRNFARKWNLGFYFDFRLKNNWWLYTGVLVKSNMGVDHLTDNDLEFLGATTYHGDSIGEYELSGSYSQKMNYFLVPALIKYKFKKRIYIEAGAQFGLMYKAWVEFKSDIEGVDASFKEYNKELINRIDAGVMAGMGYTFRRHPGMSLGVKYYEGLINVYKGTAGTRNRSLFIKVTIPIGAGEKAQKKKEEREEKKKHKKKSSTE